MPIIKCPNCNQPLKVRSSLRSKCPLCHSEFVYKDKETILQKAPATNNNKRTIGNVLSWLLPAIGCWIALFFMLMNFWGGFIILLSSVIILPPVYKEYTQKFLIRLRYAFIASTILLFVGAGYTITTWANSDEYKQIVAQQESDKVLAEEKQKRLEVEAALKVAEQKSREAEERALKEQAEKEALEKYIADAQSINELYPEEQDTSVTDVKAAQEANVRLMNEITTENDSRTGNEISLTKPLAVLEVVDGDTIKVAELGTLRLIGIDTPETVDPRKPVQCFGKEASDKAKSLLAGKKVRLEFDSSQGRIDKYGRTLAYVYREDGLFFNQAMIKLGFAYEYTYSTPYKYQSEFKQAQATASTSKVGLWGNTCNCEKGAEVSRSCTGCNQSTVVKSNWDCSTYSEIQTSNSCSYKCTKVVPITPAPVSQYTCNCQKTCPQMSSCAEAQYQLNTCGCSARDGDKDGIACDKDCQ